MRTRPKQGEHTDSVLHELGYKDGEIADLRKKGIV
jgi:crotonobetainyl-CoA:carnitine CoA-transferase CaiB-like acyl-CoA transferase